MEPNSEKFENVHLWNLSLQLFWSAKEGKVSKGNLRLLYFILFFISLNKSNFLGWVYAENQCLINNFITGVQQTHQQSLGCYPPMGQPVGPAAGKIFDLINCVLIGVTGGVRERGCTPNKAIKRSSFPPGSVVVLWRHHSQNRRLKRDLVCLHVL